MNTKRISVIGVVLIVAGVLGMASLISFSNGSEQQVILERKEALLEGHVFSILAPRGVSVQKQESLVNFVAGEESPVQAVLVGVFPQLSQEINTSLDCKQLGRSIVFQASVAATGKTVDVCENPLGIPGEEAIRQRGYRIYGTSGFEHSSLENEVYLIQVIAKEDYATGNEGAGQLQELFESFTVITK